MTSNDLELKADHKQLVCSYHNNVLFEQQCAAGRRPYIHPLRPVDGLGIVTEDMPAHHPWQHGLYTGLHGVNGSDFWLDQGAQVGRIEPRKPLISGATNWEINSLWRHHDGSELLVEQQIWSVQLHEKTVVLDLEWRMQAQIQIHVDQCSYGGLFLRMPYRKEAKHRVFNSEGQEGDACEQAAAHWVGLEMEIAGRNDVAGIAILDHPENNDEICKWRVDNQRGINPGSCIRSAFAIEQGVTRSWKYRILTQAGPLSAVDIQSQFKQFSQQ